MGKCYFYDSNIGISGPTLRPTPWIQSILRQYHDPKQAFENWMKRDELFGQEIIRQANTCGFLVMIVDGSVDVERTFDSIQLQFQLGKLPNRK